MKYVQWQNVVVVFCVLYVIGSEIGLQEQARVVTPIRLWVQSSVEKNDIAYETAYWRVILHEKQNPHFLRCIVRLKRACDIPECITTQEARERDRIEVVLDNLARRYGAAHTNFMRLMNKAYRISPHMPAIHYHFVPRYEKPFQFGAIHFHDKAFGYHYSKNNEKAVPSGLRRILKELLRQEFENHMPKPLLKTAFV